MSEGENQIESIGARLHRARLKKKATIEQVYKDIKVHPKLLTALEEDRYDDFLNSVYTKAFLKSYCRYLELDANKLLSDYDALRKNTAKTVPNAQPTGLEEKKDWGEYINLCRKWLLPVLGGILAVFLTVFILSMASKALKKVRGVKLFKTKTAAPIKEQQGSAMIKPLSIPQGQPLTLIVKTKGDVWLEVKVDTKTVFKSILKKGSVETYKANEQFQLWTGKGEFLDLVLNGNALGSPGGGVIKNILLTREGLKIEKK